MHCSLIRYMFKYEGYCIIVDCLILVIQNNYFFNFFYYNNYNNEYL